MTGYGRARATRNLRDITVEVRSDNNRYLDCTVKMPRMYAFAEAAVKGRVQKAVSRGKVDVFITVDATAADTVHPRTAIGPRAARPVRAAALAAVPAAVSAVVASAAEAVADLAAVASEEVPAVAAEAASVAAASAADAGNEIG